MLAAPRELQEARNALAAYERLGQWDAHREDHLLAAHRQLMHGLLDHPGVYRRGGVGVMGDGKVLHMAPQAGRVPLLMGRLFDWLAHTGEHPLIASSVFHCEFEFIHPFADGNGRMGRLWQTLLLSRWQPAFAWLPVESLVHQQQAAYYQALNASTAATDSAPFIRFMLGCIRDALRKAGTKTRVDARVQTRVKTPEQILALLREHPDMSLAEVAQTLGRASSTVERAVAKLQAEQRLRFDGPKKGAMEGPVNEPTRPRAERSTQNRVVELSSARFNCCWLAAAQGQADHARHVRHLHPHLHVPRSGGRQGGAGPELRSA